MDVPDHLLALTALLVPVARGWQRAADHALEALGVSGSAGWCLLHLTRMDGVPRQAELAQSLEISAPSLVRTIDQLEAAGLVKRIADRGDNRSNRIALTPEGRAMAAQIEARLGAVLATMFQDVPEAAVEIVVEVLDLMARRMGGEG